METYHHNLKAARGVALFLFTFLSTATPAALFDNGGGLIYDTVLDITWSQPDGKTWWDNANTWAAGLTLGGVSGWRLPYISVAAGAGPFIGPAVDCSTATELACRDNELGYMFYHNLGGTLGSSILTSGDPDLALFPTLQTGIGQDDDHWSGTDDVGVYAWIFNFASGVQGNHNEGEGLYVWAVHEGNVVPIPAAVWLFGSGLLGLIGVAGRRAA